MTGRVVRLVSHAAVRACRSIGARRKRDVVLGYPGRPRVRKGCYHRIELFLGAPIFTVFFVSILAFSDVDVVSHDNFQAQEVIEQRIVFNFGANNTQFLQLGHSAAHRHVDDVGVAQDLVFQRRQLAQKVKRLHGAVFIDVESCELRQSRQRCRAASEPPTVSRP